MHIIRLNGGLGNVLFQIGYGQLINRICDLEIGLDVSGLNRRVWERLACLLKPDVLEATVSPARRFVEVGLLPLGRPREKVLSFYSRKFSRIYYEREFASLPDPKCAHRSAYYSGYFQDKALVGIVKEMLNADFLCAVNGWRDRLTQEWPDKAVVSVHRRLGDYLSDRAKSVHGELTHDYYVSAMRELQSHFNAMEKDCVFLLFSNDLGAAKQQFGELELALDVFGADCIGAQSDIDDLQIMAACDGQVVANSTFSYWPASISEFSTCKVAPHQWFADERLNNLSDQLFDDSWFRV